MKKNHSTATMLHAISIFLWCMVIFGWHMSEVYASWSLSNSSFPTFQLDPSAGKDNISRKWDLDIYRSNLAKASQGQSDSATRRFSALSKSKTHDLVKIQCSYGPCFSPKAVFTPRIITDLSKWYLSKYMTASMVGTGWMISYTTEDLQLISNTAVGMLRDINNDSAKEAVDSSKAINYGIYADGDKENSGFDLMNDLDNINAIIFSQTTTYPSSKNIALDSLKDALRSSTSNLQAIEVASRANEASESAGQNSLIPSPDAKPLSAILNEQSQSDTLMCLPSDKVAINVASSINNPSETTISRSVINGTNGGSFGIPVTRSSTPVGNNSSEKCGPSSEFCIITEAIKYNYLLLGGGKTVSIDSVFSRHADIASQFAHADFTPWKVTRSFFESSRQSINLGKNLSLQIVVSTLPMPSANVGKTKAKDPSSDQFSPENINKNFDKVAGEVFGNYGLKYGAPYRPGEVDKTKLELTLNCSPKDTESNCFERLNQRVGGTSLQSQSERTSPQIVTSSAWNSDLKALQDFTRSFYQSIENINAAFAVGKAKPHSPQDN